METTNKIEEVATNPANEPVVDIKQSADLLKLKELSARVERGESFDRVAFNQLFIGDTATFLQNLADSQIESVSQSHLPAITKEVVEMDDILTQQMISTYRQHLKPLIILKKSTINNQN